MHSIGIVTVLRRRHVRQTDLSPGIRAGTGEEEHGHEFDQAGVRPAFLNARTDTETVDRALDDVIFQGEVLAALDGLAAIGGLDEPYASRPVTPRRKR